MNKKVISILISGVLSFSMLCGTAFAQKVDINLLYQRAFDATAKCMQLKTQESVKNARDCISKLPKNLNWAIGEFSKQVDTVQQPIFVKIIDSLNLAKNTKKQCDINASKAVIKDVIEDVYRRTWSSELDKIQQEKISNLINMVDKLNTNKNSQYIKKIQDEISDIKSVKHNDGVKNWINIYSQEVDKKINVKPSTDQNHNSDEIKNNTDSVTAEYKMAVETTEKNAVFIAPTGKKYHTKSCSTLTGETKRITIKEAERLGYTPCKRCNVQF